MKLRMLVAIGLLGGGVATAALAEAGQRNPEAAGRDSGSSSSGGSSSGGSSSGGSSSGGEGFAVPRSDPGSVSRRSGSSSEAPRVRSPRGESRDDVPGYSRSRGGRPVSGHAVERTFPPIDGGGAIIPPIYGGWGGWGWGWPYGLYYYDPFWSDPFWSSYPWLGYHGGYGPGYYGMYAPRYGAGSGASYMPEERGALRLKLKPRDAEVYVDGAYAGIVDDFDGAFQKLHLPPGTHKIEVRPPDGDPVKFEVLIVRDETVTYPGEEKD